MLLKRFDGRDGLFPIITFAIPWGWHPSGGSALIQSLKSLLGGFWLKSMMSNNTPPNEHCSSQMTSWKPYWNALKVHDSRYVSLEMMLSYFCKINNSTNQCLIINVIKFCYLKIILSLQSVHVEFLFSMLEAALSSGCHDKGKVPTTGDNCCHFISMNPGDIALKGNARSLKSSRRLLVIMVL